jgi:hypothetical protein
MRWLQCPPLFCCCLFQFDPEAIICHWWLMETKWLKKHMYECQLIFKWCSWSILIISHVLNSKICGCCNAHHCSAVPPFYLTHRPSFVAGEEWSQSDWRSTTLICTSIFPNCSWSILIIIHVLNSQICGWCNGHHNLLFLVPIWPTVHHLPLVRNWVKLPKKHMYGYKQCVQWCSWSILIMMHVLNSQICA